MRLPDTCQLTILIIGLKIYDIFIIGIVTADILAHQVLLNRVPVQATEDSVRYQIYY